MSYLMTSESVFAGHPDKVCDQISDAILDYVLRLDPDARVACECMITANTLIIAGEITTSSEQAIPYQEIAKETLNFIGYNNDEAGFNCNTCTYIVNITEQSPDIAKGVDNAGAGDQGIMFGYATNETTNYMPIAQQLANNISVIMFSKMTSGLLPWALPDGKCQITVEYNDDNTLKGVECIVVSAQHKAKYTTQEISKDILEICGIALQGVPINETCKIYINPTGQFTVGGPRADVGLTGRKLVVDAYGSACPIGGGSQSGKDPSKVDRSGTYMARYAAKNLVASGACDKCQVQLAYVIGMPQPVSVCIDTFGTERVDKSLIEKVVNELINFAPTAIIEKFDLKHMRFLPFASFGQFGREECNAPWEQLDLKDTLIEKFALKEN